MNVPLHVILWILGIGFNIAAGVTWLRKNKVMSEGVDHRYVGITYRPPEVREEGARLLHIHEVLLGIGVFFLVAAIGLTPY